MHSVLGNHKIITHQYTVNVQSSYTCTHGFNSLYTTIINFNNIINNIIVITVLCPPPTCFIWSNNKILVHV